MEEFRVSVKADPETLDEVMDELKVVGCTPRRIELTELRGTEVEFVCPKEREREVVYRLVGLIGRLCCRC